MVFISKKTNHNYLATNKKQQSLNTSVKVFESETVPELIDHRNWNNIKAIADIFPQSTSNFFGFEYRLGNNDAYADFLLCIDSGDAGKKILGDSLYPIKLPNTITQQSQWQQLINFSQVWHQGESPLGNLVHNIWLEFDIQPTVPDLPIPSVFFGLLPPDTQTDINNDMGWVTETALPLLLNRPLTPAVKQQVEQCFATLPADAHVFQIGLMLSRQIDAVRLCIRNIKPQEIVPWLQQMGWVGCIDNLTKLLEELDPFTDRVDLDVDLGDTIYPKIGLECYLTYQPSLQPKWKLLLAYLVELGLCIPEKQDKLLNYPGYLRDRQAKSNGTLKVEQMLGNKKETVFFRGLHHIKLSYQNNQAIEAKAYLYVSRNEIDVREFNAITGANKC
ncbi:MAG: hypothetical protein ACFCAD_13505 [Pleurocapsa sp.]